MDSKETKEPKDAREINESMNTNKSNESMDTLDTKETESKDTEETKELVDTKESREPMNTKEMKESKDVKEPMNPKETKELMDTKETKIQMDSKEQIDTKKIMELMDTKETKNLIDTKKNKELIDTKETKKIKKTKEPKDAKETKTQVAMKETKELMNTKETKKPIEMKETKEAMDTKEIKELMDTEQPIPTKETEGPREMKEPLATKEIKKPIETKEPIDTKEPMETKETRELMEKKKLIEPKETKEPNETKKPMESKETKEPIETKEPMETEAPLDPPESMESKKKKESLVETVTLYEEFRLIERNESEVNIAWKGAHLILFFLAFVFGSFCTFCFHIMMYMFDQKCVLYPKIVSHPSLQHIVYEYFTINGQQLQANADDDDGPSEMPIDFLNTQWVENSVCYLPTYVPLVSGLCGLIWTTMFLMCSSGTSNPTGMQRQWRALPPIFVFSIAMSCLCIYSSTITQEGLDELCLRLAEVTGSESCTYTVNVATLAYHRRIRGVYQAIMLTTTSAWLHTSCWILSALLTLVRVLLAVDFQLVRVQADLIGNIDRMLERYEKHIRSVSPDFTPCTDELSQSDSTPTSGSSSQESDDYMKGRKSFFVGPTDALFISKIKEQASELSLVPEEQYKLGRQLAIASVKPEHQFIAILLYQIIDNIDISELISIMDRETLPDHRLPETITLQRQFGQAHMTLPSGVEERLDKKQAEEVAKVIKQSIQDKLTVEETEPKEIHEVKAYSSTFNLTSEMRNILESNQNDQPSTSSSKQPAKSALKQATKGVQTAASHKVQILDSVRIVKLDGDGVEASDNESKVEDNKDDDTKSKDKAEDKESDDAEKEEKYKEDKDTQTKKEKQD